MITDDDDNVDDGRDDVVVVDVDVWCTRTCTLHCLLFHIIVLVLTDYKQQTHFIIIIIGLMPLNEQSSDCVRKTAEKCDCARSLPINTECEPTVSPLSNCARAAHARDYVDSFIRKHTACACMCVCTYIVCGRGTRGESVDRGCMQRSFNGPPT